MAIEMVLKDMIMLSKMEVIIYLMEVKILF
jgi:hypothetical protein